MPPSMKPVLQCLAELLTPAWVRSHSSRCKACPQTCDIMLVRHGAAHVALHLLLSRSGFGPPSRLALAMSKEQAEPNQSNIV